MVAYVLRHTVLVGALEQAQTGDLVQVLLFLVENDAQLRARYAVRVEQLHQVIIGKCLERAAMVLALTRGCQVDRLGAVPWLVVVALALLTIRVADVVGVLLLELVTIDIVLAGKFGLPEAEGLIEGQADTFQEKAQLQTTVVLQVVLVLQCGKESFHARRHVSPRVVIQVAQADFVLTSRGFRLKQVEINGVVI